jgi:flagellar biosynthesis protein FliP
MAEPLRRAAVLRRTRRQQGRLLLLAAVPLVIGLFGVTGAGSADAAQPYSAATSVNAAVVNLVTAPNPAPIPAPSPAATNAPGSGTSSSAGNVSVNLDPGIGKPSQTVSIILLLTVLSIAPALLMLTTAFTKLIVVLSLTRNALGPPTIPPTRCSPGWRCSSACSSWRRC